MSQKGGHWLVATVIVPLITIWIYMVGITFQNGYLNYFRIAGTFAETLPTYLMVGWAPLVGYGVSIVFVYFLIFELLSRWLVTNKTIRSLGVSLLTYLAMFLLIFVPQHYSLIQFEFAVFEYILLALIIVSHFVQFGFYSHIFSDNSMAFYLSRNFGALIVLLIVAWFSLTYAYQKGHEMAENEEAFQVFGQNPTYAVVFIGSKYLFAMPYDEEGKTLREELRIIDLSALQDPLIYKKTGKLTLVDGE